MTWFGGVSRFQFSYTDCPECNGTGFLEDTSEKILVAEYLTETTTNTPVQARKFLEVLAQILSEALLDNKIITLRGFGSFNLPHPLRLQPKNHFLSFKTASLTSASPDKQSFPTDYFSLSGILLDFRHGAPYTFR